MQAIALLHGAKKRETEIAAGRKESELSAVRATRQSLLNLPLDAYLKHRGAVEEGFKTAARFLRQHHISRVIDLPYQGQLVPFAALLAIIGPKFDHAAVRDRVCCNKAAETRGANRRGRVGGWPRVLTVASGQA